MVHFRVRAASLSEVATLLQNVVAVFDSNVAAVDSAVKGVANVSWQGDDAEKFLEQWAAWDASSVMVRTALTGLITKLYGAESGYTTTESGLGAGFSQRRQVTAATTSAGASSVARRVETGEERSEHIADAGATREGTSAV